MHLVRVHVRNFRGIAYGEVNLDGHTAFIGDCEIASNLTSQLHPC